MSRNLDSTMQAALAAGTIRIAFLVMLTFRSSTQYVWSGVGDFVYAGNVYKGVGTLGSIGGISGGIDVQAQGTSVTLSGIDPVYLNDSLTDIQVGAPAKIYFTLVDQNMQVVGLPYLLYGGTVDAPKITLGVKTCSIMLPIENRMLDLQRAQQQRYTAADQHLLYPTDTGFNSVEIQNDIAEKWGTK